MTHGITHLYIIADKVRFVIRFLKFFSKNGDFFCKKIPILRIKPVDGGRLLLYGDIGEGGIGMWELQICKNCGNTAFDTLEVFRDAIGKGIYCRDCLAVTRLVGGEAVTAEGKRGICEQVVARKAVSFPVQLRADERIIRADAYRMREGLEEARVPASVAVIEERAFFFCERLRSVTFPRGVREIGRSAFYGCKRLSEINLPDGVRFIAAASFRDCTSLRRVGLPKKLVEIGERAFAGCTMLSEIAIPTGTEYIAEGAFSACTSLRRLRLPEGLRAIEAEAFKDCTAIESVYLPSTLISLGRDAFLHCRGLRQIVYPSAIENEIRRARLPLRCKRMNIRRNEGNDRGAF